MAKLRGRPVTDLEIDGIDTRDYPDFVDAFICSGIWEDTGCELTEDDLEELNEDSGLVYDLVMERLF